MSSQKWHYFIHSTKNRSILRILKSGKINANSVAPITRYSSHPSDSNSDFLYEGQGYGVYCNYIFDKLDFNVPFVQWDARKNDSSTIVIDPSVAKDLEMYICDSVMWGLCQMQKRHLLKYTRGNLKRMPNMQKIKTHILHYKNPPIQLSTTRRMRNQIIHSHEVLFPDIPIKYIRAIICTNNKHYNKVNNYVKEHNLPIKVLLSNPKMYFYQHFEQI